MIAPIDPQSTVRAPRVRNLLLEQRLVFEAGALLAAAPWLRCMGRGDGHPVLVLPGFTTSDAATAVLRLQLRSWGYWTHGWRLGFNVGPTPAIIDGIRSNAAPGSLIDVLQSAHARAPTPGRVDPR